MSSEARLAFVGDVMLGRLVSEELPRRSPDYFWGDVLPLLKSCDAVIANLECAITRHPHRWHETEKVFHFGADPKAVDVLRAARIACVNLANNHVLDFEREGLRDTLRFLDEAGIAHAGAGSDAATALAPAFFKAGPLRMALFGCVDHEKPFAAAPGRSGANFVDPQSHPAPEYPTRAATDAARKRGAGLVVLSSHFGPNMVREPSDAIARHRRAAIAHGVDIVHGHSAHLFQGVERSGGGLILHDTGDFLDDYAIDPELRNDWSFVFVVEADANGVRGLKLHPVVLEFAHVRLAREDEAAAMFERMIGLSRAFGSELKPAADGMTLELAMGPQKSALSAQKT